MHWRFTDEQRSYAATFRDWLADVAPLSQVRTWFDDGDVQPFRDRFARDGWAGVGIADDAGGQGGGVLELALTAEELGRAGAPDTAWLAAVLVATALAARPELAAAALTGRGTALAVSADAVPAAARPLEVDAAGRVSGTVPRVLAPENVDALLVPVASSDGVALLLVPAADAVHLRPYRLLDRSRSVLDVTFDTAAGERLDLDAAAVLERVTDLAGVLLAADALGAMERMLELTVEYSGQRHQFGVPIGSLQAVKHAAAELEVGVEAIRSAVYYAAASVAAGTPDAPLHAAAVRAQAGATAARAADTALTLHGAIGYTWEHDLQLFYKRAKLDAQLFGAAEQWNERIATALLLVE